MTEKLLLNIVQDFELLDKHSLNQDPFSFTGKYVFDFDGYIYKIESLFDFIGYQKFLILNKECPFFTQNEVLYQGNLVLYRQKKIQIQPLSNFKDLICIKDSLNIWCPTQTQEEAIISQLVFDQYGEENWNKIYQICSLYCVGNIYWRNIGFNEKGMIKCFDFYIGLPKNEKGIFKCINGLVQS